MSPRSATGSPSEEGGAGWIQTFLWGALLSTIMFGLGFLAGSQWGGSRSEPAPMRIRPLPPPVEVNPSVVEPSDTPPEEGGRWWSILEETGEKESETLPSLPPPRVEDTGSHSPPPPSTKRPFPHQKGTTGYVVQVASYRDPARARALQGRLIRMGGYPRVWMEKAEIPRRGTWYRIRVGGFADRTQAQEAAERISRQLGVQPRVLRGSPPDS